MRYIKLPKKVTGGICQLDESVWNWSKQYDLMEECMLTSIKEYAMEWGHEEAIVDVDVFRSVVVRELLK